MHREDLLRGQALAGSGTREDSVAGVIVELPDLLAGSHHVVVEADAQDHVVGVWLAALALHRVEDLACPHGGGVGEHLVHIVPELPEDPVVDGVVALGCGTAREAEGFDDGAFDDVLAESLVGGEDSDLDLDGDVARGVVVGGDEDAGRHGLADIFECGSDLGHHGGIVVGKAVAGFALEEGADDGGEHGLQALLDFALAVGVPGGCVTVAWVEVLCTVVGLSSEGVLEHFVGEIKTSAVGVGVALAVLPVNQDLSDLVDVSRRHGGQVLCCLDLFPEVHDDEVVGALVGAPVGGEGHESALAVFVAGENTGGLKNAVAGLENVVILLEDAFDVGGDWASVEGHGFFGHVVARGFTVEGCEHCVDGDVAGDLLEAQALTLILGEGGEVEGC